MRLRPGRAAAAHRTELRVHTVPQLVIFFTIQNYGALPFALMMVLRQWLSMALSCMLFRHHLTPLQWCAQGALGEARAPACEGALSAGIPRGGRALTVRFTSRAGLTPWW